MGKGAPDRTLRLQAGPPLCRDAWRRLSAAVRDGEPVDRIEELRAEFSRELERYGR